jgi:hypothetical protein
VLPLRRPHGLAAFEAIRLDVPKQDAQSRPPSMGLEIVVKESQDLLPIPQHGIEGRQQDSAAITLEGSDEKQDEKPTK